jgi:hypothetical protein
MANDSVTAGLMWARDVAERVDHDADDQPECETNSDRSYGAVCVGVDDRGTRTCKDESKGPNELGGVTASSRIKIKSWPSTAVVIHD